MHRVCSLTCTLLLPYGLETHCSINCLISEASMARKIYLRGGIGVGAFKKIYGGRKSNGVRPSHFAKSSGSIARHCLKQLEALNIVEKDVRGSVPSVSFSFSACAFLGLGF